MKWFNKKFKLIVLVLFLIEQIHEACLCMYGKITVKNVNFTILNCIKFTVSYITFTVIVVIYTVNYNT